MTLDIATKTGFAVLNVSGTIISGNLDFAHNVRKPSEHRPEVLARAYRELSDLIDEHRPNLIVYESPFHRGPGTRLLWSLCGLVETLAAQRSITVAELHASRIRQLLTGSGKSKKSDVQAWLDARGVHYESDDEADALAIMHAVLISNDQSPFSTSV